MTDQEYRSRLIKSYMSSGYSFDLATGMADRQIQEEAEEDLRLQNNFDASKSIVEAYDLYQEHKRKIYKKLIEHQKIERNRDHRKVRDHRGVEFSSFNQMCIRWGTTWRTVKERLAKGWALKDALTKSNQTNHPCVDHLGKHYPSVKAMLNTYGISASAFQSRKQKGWDLKRILETPQSVNACVDHRGNKFPSRKAMCEFWKIPRREFYKRLSAHWSLQDALNVPYEPRR